MTITHSSENNTDFFAHKDPQQHLKKHVKEFCDKLAEQFDPKQSVASLIKEKSDFIDNILTSCWKHFFAKFNNDFALIAVGGYGRREVFPHSDIDIMVLQVDTSIDAFQDSLGAFSTFLWDIGLKPGQSLRSINECIETASNDQTIMTSLLEMRFITGNKALFEQLAEQINSDQIWPSEQFFAAKLAEQNQRYSKFHETAYNLEPNAKEGPGGLRDMQVIAWVFKKHYHSTSLRELIDYDFLPQSEYDELIAARNKLWRIRYALHILTKTSEERLLFDYQRELAEWFGYTDNENNQSVEQFMQFYYNTVVGLERLNEMLLQLFSERFVNLDKKSNKIVTINTRFYAIKGYIEVKHENVFIEQPTALLEIFLLLQQTPSLKGIRATTIRQIRKNLHLIDDKFRHNKAACQLFIEILKQPHGITHQLRQMNRYGVLAAYLPSFANIVSRMQYDLFHIYTVDVHTLFVIRNLRRFSLDKHNHELPFCNNVFLFIRKPHVLYLAALFHDIAKGKGGNHSELGEEIARDFCVQHDLPEQDTKLITWLVNNHLIMSMTAQRKDISDPDIIHEFAEQVGSTEYLNYLYLLTVADIRATNPKLWNSWKDTLLKELYTSAHNALRLGLQNPIVQQDRIDQTRKETRIELLSRGISNETINSAWKHVNEDFFLRYYVDEIVWHTIAISSFGEHKLPLVLIRPQTQRGSAEIFIYMKNKDNIFSISTAILDRLGLIILDARISTAKENYVLNSFQVLEQLGKPIDDLRREIHICNTLRKHLTTQKHKNSEIFKLRARQAKHFPITTKIIFHNLTKHNQTVMELITSDRLGLLSMVGKVLRQQNIIINSAKITTISSRVEDMFYISDQDGQPISDPEKQQQIKDELFSILS